MDLYFSPFSCSLATRMSLYELDLPANFIQVDLRTKKLVADGSNYVEINPKGQVPALRTDSGVLLTEASAILQYVADLDAAHRLAPPAGTIERAQLHQWLNYLATDRPPRADPVAKLVEDQTGRQRCSGRSRDR